MYKQLLTVFTLLITLSIAAQPVFATVSPNAPQAPTVSKKYYDAWQQMTLRNILHQHVTVTVVPTNKPTPTPTPKVVSSSSNTPTPTKKPASPTPTKAPVTTAPATNDVTSYIMKEINAYRASLGLSSVQTNNETCNFARIRAQEIANGFNHDGFNNRKNSHTLPYASWTAITENIAMTPNYKDVEKMWQNSAGHAANMRANTPYVCVMQHGNYFAYEGMKP
jgi:uncharacterized protein YkwD